MTKKKVWPERKAGLLCAATIGKRDGSLAAEKVAKEARNVGYRVVDGPYEIGVEMAGEVEIHLYASAAVRTWRHWWIRLTGGAK